MNLLSTNHNKVVCLIHCKNILDSLHQIVHGGGSRGGDRVSGPPPPLKNHKNIGFPTNIDPDPLKITKLNQSQHSMVGHNISMPGNAISMAFRWGVNPLSHHQQKKNSQSWTPSAKTFWIRACSVDQDQTALVGVDTFCVSKMLINACSRRLEQITFLYRLETGHTGRPGDPTRRDHFLPKGRNFDKCKR